MNVLKSKTETYVISGAERLDAITVYVLNISKGQGKITIECYGSSWSSFWGGMGNQSLQSFFAGCDNQYLLNRLVDKRERVDFDSISSIAQEKGIDLSVENEAHFAFYVNELEECFGEDWFMNLPMCSTYEYVHAGKIVDIIRSVFVKEIAESKEE